MEPVNERNRRRSGRRGFTLLEVLIATVLLAVGLLALMTLQIQSIRNSAFSNSMTVASCLAQDEVERLRAIPWKDLNDGTFSETVNDTDPATGATRMVFGREWTIRTDGSGRIREILVTVSWHQHDRLHRITMATRIAKRE
ncbi:MAG: type IV pilus modification protein PilV [Deltaproteobacteria bacterium]|nr:type IV pilus modification protein PilV [Deltaproteobacteria bacterium]MBW2121535.1 type IV pilus modification protein PilV [Deltaproteobacteria bacterium]